MLCDNCLHKPVCGKFRATGGQVQKCDHLLEQKHGRWEEWWPPAHMIMTGEEKLYRCTICDAKYSNVESYRHCPYCGNPIGLFIITDQTMDALEKMGAQAHGEREITSE